MESLLPKEFQEDAPAGDTSQNLSGPMLEDGRWMFMSAVSGIIMWGICLVIFWSIFDRVATETATFFIVFASVFALVEVAVLFRFFKFDKWLKTAAQPHNRKVVQGVISSVKWSFGASWISPGGTMFGRIYRVEYTYQEDGIQKQGRAYLRDVRPFVGATVNLLTHDGRTAIFNIVR